MKKPKQYPPAVIERTAQRLSWNAQLERQTKWDTPERQPYVPIETFRDKVKANPEEYVTQEDFVEAVFDPTYSAMDYRCYDEFPSVAAAEKFFKRAKEQYGVAGSVVYTPDDPIMKMGKGKHGCDNYPFVLMQEGWYIGGSGNYILELAHLAEKHGGTYQYS